MKDITLHEQMDMPDPNFPIKLLKGMKKGKGIAVNSHWHEQMELLLFRKGRAHLQCDRNSCNAGKNTLILVNCNDIHSCESLSHDLDYDCIILDISLLKSGFMDSAQVKFITPVMQNTLLFENEIRHDRDVLKCLETVIGELQQKDQGYELAIKAEVFRFFTLLVRNHVSRRLTPQEYDLRTRTLERFKSVFEYVEKSYTDRITVEDISAVANLSPYYFCRLFKDTTGRSFIDYLNGFRIDKAETLLKETSITITEAALACGFNDINYFSRLFKRYKNVCPSGIR